MNGCIRNVINPLIILQSGFSCSREETLEIICLRCKRERRKSPWNSRFSPAELYRTVQVHQIIALKIQPSHLKFHFAIWVFSVGSAWWRVRKHPAFKFSCGRTDPNCKSRRCTNDVAEYRPALFLIFGWCKQIGRSGGFACWNFRCKNGNCSAITLFRFSVGFYAGCAVRERALVLFYARGWINVGLVKTSTSWFPEKRVDSIFDILLSVGSANWQRIAGRLALFIGNVEISKCNFPADRSRKLY